MPPTLEHLLRTAATSADVVSFAGGLPAPESFPRDALARAAAAAALGLADADPLQYEWAQGRPRLRAWIARYLQARGADVEPDDVVVTNGAQDALALALDVLHPKRLAVDDPTYAGALDLFRGRRTELVPVDDVSADARYAMPALMNPWGRAMTVAERAQALALPFVLEDDAYADLRFDGPPPPPLLVEARERVFFIGSFSKVLAPGLRVGWLVAPRAFTSRVQELKAQNDVHTGALAQAIVERVLDELDFEAHVASLRSLYAARCGRLVEALREAPHLSFTPPEGGFGVWIRCDVPADDAHWLARAIAAGVAFDPGSLFRVHAGAQLELRACFSFVDPARMRCGVERLARLLEPRHSVAA